MTDLAAIAGSFSDAKLIKSRSIMQIIVEVPIEQADAALRALGGVPQPGAERAVAVALLNTDKIAPGSPGSATDLWYASQTPGHLAPGKAGEQQGAASILSGPSPASPAASPTPEPQTPAKETDGRRSTSQDRVVQRCAILCDDRQFQRWLWLREGRSKERFDAQSMELAAQDAAATVRAICGIASRRDLAIDNAARRRWDALLLAYEQAVGLAPVDHRRSA